MRRCPTCPRELSEEDYGKSFYCRFCMAARARARRAANPEKYRDQWKKIPKEKRKAQIHRWREANSDHVKAYRRKNYADNRDRDLTRQLEYKQKNKVAIAEKASARLREQPEINRFARSIRRAIEKQAMPKWANRAKMKAFYKEAARLTRETGVDHHVDHIVPLKSEIVCGLHWEGNLQILPAKENQQKKNFFWPDMAA